MKYICAIMFSLYSAIALSYPIFVKCEEGGRLSDKITPPELSSRLQKMLEGIKDLNNEEKNKEIEKICSGGALCMQELNQLLQMSEVAGKISHDLIQAEVQRISDKASKTAKSVESIVSVPENLFSSVSQYQSAIQNIALAHECRVEGTKLDPKLFDKSGNCILANFGHSPYMYPSGIRFSGTDNISGNKLGSSASCSTIDEIIESSIATNNDPYAVMALSLMETGSDMYGLGLDPIGTVQTLGCPTTPGSAKSHNLDSYSTYYNVKWGSQKNERFSKSLQQFAKLKNIELEEGESYYCFMNTDDEVKTKADDFTPNVHTEGGQFVISSSQPTFKKTCCAKVPFSAKSLKGMNAPGLLTYSSFDKYLEKPLDAKITHSDGLERMARRLQRFNGYTDSMGGAEGVPAWRSGVNYYKTPAYGYQAMDFIFNTLWNNPYIQHKVKAVEEKLQLASKSIFCQEKEPGVYAVEHDVFFKKHGEAPRMQSLRERYKIAQGYSKLKQRDKNVFRNEVLNICVESNRPLMPFCTEFSEVQKRYHKIKAAITENEKKEYSEENDKKTQKLYAEASNVVFEFWDKTNKDKLMTQYWSAVYPKRQTIADANKMDQGFLWKQMDEQQFQSFLEQIKKPDNKLYPKEQF